MAVEETQQAQQRERERPSGDVHDRPLAAVSEEDRAVAERLAEEVHRSSDRGRSWRRVTTLLDMFGAYRLSPEVRARIAAALRAAELEAVPPIEEAQRFETVRLSIDLAGTAPGAAERRRSQTSILPATEVVDVTEWRPGEHSRPVRLFDLARPDPDRGVLWFNVDALHAEADSVFELLEPVCEGLTEQMVVNLLQGDPRPRVQTLGDERPVRAVSAFSVSAEESESGGTDADSSKAGALVFQLVELLQGERWLITCWHRGKRYEGAEEVAETAPHGYGPMLAAADRRWAQGGLSTPGDLGVLILRELVVTYPSATRVLRSWLDQWELDFHRRVDRTERETLIAIRSLLVEFEDRVVAFEQPHVPPAQAWFTGLSDPVAAETVAALTTRTLADCSSLNEALRAELDLLGVHSAAQQLELAQHQTAQNERLQRQVAVITAVLLVPTFIAGFFGANTQLPGKEAWSGFILMLVLIAVGAVVAYRLIRPRTGNRDDRSHDDRA